MIVCVLLSGCFSNRGLPKEQSAASLQEAGTTHVSVIAVAPWDSVKSSLTPKFELTGPRAYDATIPVTQRLTEKMLDAIDVRIGLRQTGVSRESTETNSATASNEKPTTTGTKSQSQTAGVNVNDGCAAGSVDPILRYQAAVGLLQEVQLLNRYIEHVKVKAGYRGYLVRMQVALLPRRHHLPYDAYTNIYLYPRDLSARWTGDGAPIFVAPIVASDNLEGSAAIRAVETIRATGLTLEGVFAGTGLGIGAAKRSEEDQSASGTDLNALMTVTREANNAIRVRLGAMYQGSSRYAMVPRTHNVTFLVLVAKGIESMRMVTKTSLVNTETGEALTNDPSRKRAALRASAATVIKDYGYIFDPTCSLLEYEPEPERRELEFLRLVGLGQYGVLQACLKTRATAGQDTRAEPLKAPDGEAMKLSTAPASEHVRLSRMMSQLLELLVDSEYGEAEFDLPEK